MFSSKIYHSRTRRKDVVDDTSGDRFSPTHQTTTSGTNDGLIRAMDLSFIGLILTLLALLLITNGNLHVLALMLVAVCLWTSVRWFVAELARMNHLNKPISISIDDTLSKNDKLKSS
ncbi:hypothetical protein H4Q26_014555 [Puccinia striiformis f. sp. tritici PST-130]|nr:hypothetical protein H4Q26_014555 [Puccinia striiformis f. sp. tritici PST-130]